MTRKLAAALLLTVSTAARADENWKYRKNDFPRNRVSPSTYWQPPAYKPQQSMPTSYYGNANYQHSPSAYGNTNSYPGSSYGQPKYYPTGPSKPPKMATFQDKFTMMVKQYVGANSQDGVFSIRDDQTGKLSRLKFRGVPSGQIRQVGTGEMIGCALFEDAKGRPVDLDFRLNKEDWDWKIREFLVHSVDGQERFRYDADNRIVAVGQAPAAPAPAPAAAPAAAPEPAAVPKPTAPAALALKAAFSEASGDSRLEGDETGAVEVVVQNTGKGAAYAVRLEVKGPGKAISHPEAIEVGTIKPGKSARVSVPLEAAAALGAGKAKLRLKAREGNGFDSDAVVLEFETRALKAPRLEIAHVGLAGGKAVAPGAASRAIITVRNKGTGDAKGVSVALSLGSADLFLSGEPVLNLGTIKPGQTKQAEFEFFVNKRAKGGSALPMTASVTESKGRYGLDSFALGLRVGESRAAPAVMSVAGADEEDAIVIENVDAPPKARVRVNPDAYAVVVGIERYRDVPGVDFAARDAEAVYGYLTKAMGFDKRNVVLLQDERATLTDLTTYLGPWLQDRVGAESRVFIFFAGHGAPNPRTGDAYLIPYDGNPNYTETKDFPLARLFETLSKLPSQDITVALDACFSGAGGRSVLAAGARPLVHMKSMPELGPNIVLLTASGHDQISTFYREAQHGLLTYFMLKGLRGAADLDRDKAVTTSELYTYLKPAVETEARRQHVEQTPTLTPSASALGPRSGQVWIKLK